MNIRQLKFINRNVIAVISNHIIDSNDKYLLKKKYLDVSDNDEMQYKINHLTNASVKFFLAELLSKKIASFSSDDLSKLQDIYFYGM